LSVSEVLITARKRANAKTSGAARDAQTIEATEIAGAAAAVQETVERTASGFPIVGIGASAGGLAAFEAFFSGMPADADPDMAFVLVQHLAPDRKSILAWNPGAARIYGWSEAEALVMNVRDRIPVGLREEALAKVDQLSQADILESYRTQRITKGGTVIEVSMISTALVNEAGQVHAIATTERLRDSKIGRTLEAHSGRQA